VGPRAGLEAGVEEKSSAPVGDRNPIVQPIVRHYTDCAFRRYSHNPGQGLPIRGFIVLFNLILREFDLISVQFFFPVETFL
jgi:hypothetical protein